MDVKPKFLRTETVSALPSSSSCVEATSLNTELKDEEESNDSSVDCEQNEEVKIDDSLVVMRGEDFVVTLDPDYLEEFGEDVEDALRLDSSTSPGCPALPTSPPPDCHPSGWGVTEGSEGVGRETGEKRAPVTTRCGGGCSSDTWGEPQVCFEGTAKKRKRDPAAGNSLQNSQLASVCVLPERKPMPCTDRDSGVKIGFAFLTNDQLYVLQSQASNSIGNHSKGEEVEKHCFIKREKETVGVQVDWKQHQCPMCEKNFDHKGTMELHIMIVHKGRSVGSGSGGNSE